ncbi:YcdB/YcdC domain-containing protein [Ammoniphilus sp. YIM 78166]|uniref:YcdB/YcdC domain-containing protein n=1 Tax=Ammoniphilus sp. YIM 78166 TaxID=1644106 RepID=UPI001431736D|nr:YcdB/YcdC domain-containing protein [Ammoniphilus sp. YIM 78166]
MKSFHKKGFPILLASTLMFTSGVIPAFANETMPAKPAEVISDTKAMEAAKISKEQALEIAKKAVPIPQDFVQRNVEFHSNWWGNQTAAWIIYWDRQTPPQYGHAQVVVDAATGNVLNVEVYNNQNSKPSYPPKTDITRAKEIAQAYIEKHYPDKAGQLIYDDRFEQIAKPPLNGHVEYPLIYKRLVNGIPFEGNEIRITINGDGQMINFGYRWQDDLEFPKPEKLLSQEQAVKLYQDQVKLSLKLLPQWGPISERKTYVGYLPQTANYYHEPIYIRATDGALVTIWGDVINEADTVRVPVSDKKLGELTQGKVTEAQALEILKKHFSLPKDASMIRSSFREQWGETQTSVWEFNWETRNEGMVAGWSMAAVDATTGRVLNYSNEKHVIMEKEGAAKVDAKVKREQAQQKAMELMRTLHPDIAHQLYLQKMPPSPYEEAQARYHSFMFIREVNGISLEHGGINVNIDALTGDVSHYWFHGENLTIPETKQNYISPQEALSAYMARLEIPLIYMLPQEKPVMNPGTPVKPNKKAMLIYQPRLKEFGESVFLDAVTSKWTNRETGQAVVEVTEVKDIRGHRAEKELQTLLRYNVFDVDNGMIKPDEEITRGELVKMLVLVENNGYRIWYDGARTATFSDVKKDSPYFSYVEHAIDRNWIDRNQAAFNPNEKINREELATLIIRALGFENLAKMDNLFINDLQDANTIKNIGAAILASKLGIVEVQNGKFVPQGQVTRAEAAVSFSRYLTKRSELRY